MSKTITKESLVSTFPIALKSDDSISALAEITAELFAERIDDISLINIYSNIDSLPEAMLDILAYDFKVDWWDHDLTLEEKRKTLKDSFIVHKRLGTKEAVETAISDVYPESKVQEWWEYGGEPYWFRLLIEANGIRVDSRKHKRILQLVDFYKSLRSHLGEIIYRIRPKSAVAYSSGALGGCHFSFTVNVNNPYSAKAKWFSSATTAGTHIKMEVNINGMETIAGN